MKKRKWMNYLWGILLAAAMPNMMYAATPAAGQHIAQNESLQAMAMSGLVTQGEVWYASPINIKPEILSPFNEARTGYMHQGIDLRMPVGTPIYAIADATVIKAAPDSKGVDAGGGHIIMLDHGNGIQTWYMHLDAYAVSNGEKVKKGQLIGFSGCSGDSTAPLLHFEYRVNGVPAEPSFIFNQTQVTGTEKIEETKTLITLNEPFFVVQS